MKTLVSPRSAMYAPWRSTLGSTLREMARRACTTSFTISAIVLIRARAKPYGVAKNAAKSPESPTARLPCAPTALMVSAEPTASPVNMFATLQPSSASSPRPLLSLSSISAASGG